LSLICDQNSLTEKQSVSRLITRVFPDERIPKTQPSIRAFWITLEVSLRENLGVADQQIARTFNFMVGSANIDAVASRKKHVYGDQENCDPRIHERPS
jgi:hypothetical protein